MYKIIVQNTNAACRGGSRAAATSKMECFMIIVHGWKPLIIITKRSILDVAAALDPPLNILVVIQYANIICDVLRDLVPIIQFKKREKHPWKSVTFSKNCRLKDCNFIKKHSSMGVFHVF